MNTQLSVSAGLYQPVEQSPLSRRPPTPSSPDWLRPALSRKRGKGDFVCASVSKSV